MERKDNNESNSFGEKRESIRQWFPSLKSKIAFLDNAGGSQMPGVVADQIRHYFLNTYVQVGADYETSRIATNIISEARDFVKLFMNGEGLGQVVLGPSTSSLVATLAGCYARSPDRTRNEIIVCESGHEANVGPWLRLADRGFRVHMWNIDKETFETPISKLETLLNARTRIVAVPHVSNLLGVIDNMDTITRLAHDAGAKVVIDGVAFAPHRAIDVKAIDADFYVYSIYKVYGPHMAALFGKSHALSELEGPNHFFVDNRDIPYKFELGGVLHEGCAGILGIRAYLSFLANQSEGNDVDRNTIESAFHTMTELELPLQEKLIRYLVQKDAVHLIGPAETGMNRVATISFVHHSKSSKEIVLAANDQGLGIRYGHFYAHRLASAVGLDPEDGVVRTSLLHYNTEKEVDRLIDFFESAL